MLHANYFLPFILHFLQNIFSDISQKDFWLHQKGIHKEGQLRRRPETVAELSEETFGTFGSWKKTLKKLIRFFWYSKKMKTFKALHSWTSSLRGTL